MGSAYDRARGAYSTLQRERLATAIQLPAALRSGFASAQSVPAAESGFYHSKYPPQIKDIFKHTFEQDAVVFKDAGAAGASVPASLRVGVVLSGGQAPGGHNVITGIYDQAKRITGGKAAVYGFLDGPHGIFSGNYVELTDEIIDGFRNTGGFDMLGAGRHKIESPQQFADSMATAVKLELDGLIVIGGDDSNTNAALLAEYFKANKCACRVVGCPKTIDGDLKVPPFIPVSFGFDTACRTYAELVGSLCSDALSTQKYYHFVRLMGRSATNIALEVQLQTCANVCLIGEEVQQKKQSLRDLVNYLVDVIVQRYESSKRKYGVILLPEGLIEFIPEFELLIADINEALSKSDDEAVLVNPSETEILPLLKPENQAAFRYLPDFIKEQLLLDRDPHGNVQVAKIETEKLLAACVRTALLEKYSGAEAFVDSLFAPQFHAYGYEGRAGLPSVFDSSYCYALGATASVLIANGLTGLISSVRNLNAPVEEWVSTYLI